MRRVLLCGFVVLVAIAVYANCSQGGLLRLDNAAVTVSGTAAAGTSWNDTDGLWEFQPTGWVWDGRFGDTGPFLLANYGENTSASPATIQIALGNGMYDLGFKWYAHGYTYDVGLPLTVEGVTANQAMVATSEAEYQTSYQSVGSFAVTDGVLTMVLGDATAPGHEDRWFSLGAVDVTVSPLPEPSTCVLVLTGAVSLLAYAWRRRK